MTGSADGVTGIGDALVPVGADAAGPAEDPQPASSRQLDNTTINDAYRMVV